MMFIYSMPMPVLFVLTLMLCLLFGLPGVWLTHKKQWLVHEDDNEIISLAHSFAGVVYAVALGLLVVDVQSDYSTVERLVMEESNLAVDLYIDLDGLGDIGNQAQVYVMSYVDSVIKEWCQIFPNTVHRLGSQKDVDNLLRYIINLKPSTDKEFVIYAEVLSGVNDLLDLRRQRLHLGVDGVGLATWMVIMMGAFITIGMTWFYAAKHKSAHYAVVGVMSLMFGLMVFLIVAMDHPLLGEFSVNNSAFLEAKCDIAKWDNDTQDPPQACLINDKVQVH